MNENELKAVLDIVNKELDEAWQDEHIGSEDEGWYFSMDNPEKDEWIKKLRKEGVLLTKTKEIRDNEPYTAKNDELDRGAAWLRENRSEVVKRRGKK